MRPSSGRQRDALVYETQVSPTLSPFLPKGHTKKHPLKKAPLKRSPPKKAPVKQAPRRGPHHRRGPPKTKEKASSHSSDKLEPDDEAIRAVDVLLETLTSTKAIKDKKDSLALVPYKSLTKGHVYHETQVKVSTYFLSVKKKYAGFSRLHQIERA